MQVLASCVLAALPSLPAPALAGAGEPFATLELTSPATHLAVAARADLVVVAEENGLVRLLDVATLRERGRVDAAVRPLDLAVSDDGRWIAVRTAEATVAVWSATSDEPQREPDHLLAHEGAFAFRAGSASLVLADMSGGVRQFDTGTGESSAAHTFEDRRAIEGIEISRDGRVVTFALDDG